MSQPPQKGWSGGHERLRQKLPAAGEGLRLALFGDFAACDVSGAPVVITSKKNRALLAVLALSPGLSATRDRLANLLWSDRDDEHARSSLRQSLAVLRRELGPAGAAAFSVRDDAISLLPSAIDTDVLEFRNRAPAADIASLRQAAQLYRGEFLAGIGIRDPAFEEWLASERARFREAAVDVLDRLSAAETGPARIAAAQRLLSLDPLREASHRMLMQAYTGSGENGLALKQFETCRALLLRELGIEPSPETLALRDRLASSATRAESPQADGDPRRSTPAKPTIAVLPFVNMSGDPEQEYFSDGITEDIITELSRFKTLFVVARNSSFIYKGKFVSIATVARELDVAYVIEGSVRRAGNRVRITAQLVNAETSAHVWAERYDRELADIFAVQDEVTMSIVGMLALGLEDEALQSAQRKRPENLLAYDHWLRGKRLLWTSGPKNTEARQHFEAAAGVDSAFSRAYSGLAVVYQLELLEFPTPEDFRRAYDNAQACAARALELDEADHQAHIAAAWPCLYCGDYTSMKKHVERALLLNPNDADTLANATYLLAMHGDAEEAVRCGQKAMVLNPRYPDWYAGYLSGALFTARRYEEAATYRLQAPDIFVDSAFWGAAILAHLDRIEEARQWAAKAVARLATRPGSTSIATRGCVQMLLDNNPFRRLEDRDHFADGMRKAGVPG